LSNRIEDLHPCFQPVWRRILTDGQAALDAQFPGSKVLTAETLRTMDDQRKDYLAGTSDVKLGWHQYGLAVDFTIMDEHGNAVEDGADPRYALIGNIAAGLGCHYPIILSHGQPDYDHVQMGGFTLAQYQAWLKEHPAP
jgi:hypothetical protein